MDVDMHNIKTSGGGYWEKGGGGDAIADAMESRRVELEAQGNKAIIVSTGGAYPFGFVTHLLTFLEMSEQSQGTTLDYIYYTTGTGTALWEALARSPC
ncbi:hypothetical protein ACHAPJ_009653 [Fusarium lateritium]